MHCLHNNHEKNENALKNAEEEDEVFSPGFDGFLHGLTPNFGALPPFVLSHQDSEHLIAWHSLSLQKGLPFEVSKVWRILNRLVRSVLNT